MKIEAKTIDELIAKARPRTEALRKLDALIVVTAPQLEPRLFSGPSITMIAYGEVIWGNRSSSGIWPVIAIAPQKRYTSMCVEAETDGVSLVQAYAGKLGRTTKSHVTTSPDLPG